MSEIAFPIETERLLLRPAESDDSLQLHPIYSEAWPNWPSSLSSSPGQTREIVEWSRGIQARHGFSMWLALEKTSGAVVGNCGLQPLERRGPEVEVGYRLGRRYWGQGLATEGATACLRVAFDVLGLERIVAVTMPGNAASRRVMEKLGMVYEGTGDYYGHKQVRYALSSDAGRGDAGENGP